jgi:hypothetical protein
MARLLGWDAPHYDTMPNDKFNIWHFPIEYRALPGTRDVTPAGIVPFITATDLQKGGASIAHAE